MTVCVSRMRPALVALAALLVSAVQVKAQPAPALDRTSRRFVERMAEESNTDAALAQLGADRAQDQRIRQLAFALGRDWSSLMVEAGALAHATNQPLENDLTGDRLYRRVSHIAATKFDAQFVALAIERCGRQIDQLQTESAHTKDDQIRSFATAQLDRLERDLALARQLQRTLRE